MQIREFENPNASWNSSSEHHTHLPSWKGTRSVRTACDGDEKLNQPYRHAQETNRHEHGADQHRHQPRRQQHELEDDEQQLSGETS